MGATGPRDFREVVAENVTRDALSRRGDGIDCRRCGVRFVRGDWCFHALCDPCFARFDRAKMDGRCGVGPVCEDVEAWIRAELASAAPG
jgi:hypothetical protein